MANYEVRLTRSARKELESIGTKRERGRIVEALTRLADDPRPVGSVKLASADITYRIRIGDYRVIYDVQDDAAIVDVLRVRHRRDAYR